MLDFLRQLFGDDADAGADDERDIRLAAAALLVEVARADHDLTGDEEAAMRRLLVTALGLDEGDVETILERAGTAVEDATSLYEFTRLVNDHYSFEEKRQLVAAMWQVAYADEDLDKYEEHIIRRVAELIYLPHAEFMRSKHEAMAARDGA